jgi:hypothetical protein
MGSAELGPGRAPHHGEEVPTSMNGLHAMEKILPLTAAPAADFAGGRS